MRGEAFARQLRLLALLEARREGIEPEEAAAELGTRRRTVYRDFRVLEDAGFPLTSALDGRRARWRMVEGYRHRLQLALTWSELLALMTARQMVAALAGTTLHDGAASALEKIRATLPRGLAERFRSSEHIVSAPGGGRDYRSRGELVRRLVEAVDARETVAARYRSRGARGRRGVDRRLDPYHLRVAEEGLYLLAWCHRSRQVKLFLVDRFDDVRSTGEGFDPPAGFDAEALLRSRFGMWSGRPRRVRFKVAPEIADLLMERKVHPSQVAQRRTDGSLEVRLDVAIGPPLVAYLTGLGAGVSEIAPAELRAAVTREHRRALEGLGIGLAGGVTSRDTGAA
ncbi:MAG TPA: WYL domain-containing protein [Anaeromyxobacteraceae bacterium]|nr:WYL domain-containing protein [Anaeromyxobacteraceae bacterium]